jgi:macrodomain Ter protein organizer (MatP/YcbG family)
MARPRIIQDVETKDVHVILGKALWERLSKKAHDNRSSVSALVRKAVEETYGKAKGGI